MRDKLGDCHWHMHTTIICCCLVTESWLTLCDPMHCRLPGSSVLRISQARLLEWVAISFSRGSSLPRDGTHFSCVVRQILYHWVTGRALEASTRSIIMKYSSFLWRIFMRDPQQCWNHAPILILCPWLPSPPSLYMFLKIYDFCFLRLLYSPI